MLRVSTYPKLILDTDINENNETSFFATRDHFKPEAYSLWFFYFVVLIIINICLIRHNVMFSV
jgi:hypothetical protein